MKRQQYVVEEAIEHMAVRHCADLNSSVAAVGRMSRQFDEAKLRVRNLRRQVRDVKDSLRLGELGMGELVRQVLFFCLSVFLLGGSDNVDVLSMGEEYIRHERDRKGGSSFPV